MTWRGTAVSPSGTHHVRRGVPLYAERFDEVLKFHEPGLAAVRRDGQAWHIGSDGAAAYGRRFDRTFGFYEGLAAAADSGGWRHVRPDGGDLCAARFAWCGNFQGGRCTVREAGGAYLHVTPDGVSAYDARWRYAGDFRDDAAVVQAGDGRSTHIDPHGVPIHGKWFVDLDVFHKGCARARDEDGWTHIDRAGRPLYRRRFAAVEPFYNGQARVERFDGGLEVIDETGVGAVELRPALKSEFAALSDDLAGFWRTQAICAAVELGVFEALPATAAGLARRCGLESGRARRLLRALAELRLAADEDGMWRATARGAFLAADHPWTLADAAVEYGRAFPKMWDALPRALRADPGLRPPDVFAEVASDPARVASHHRMLASYALHDYGPALRLLRHARHARGAVRGAVVRDRDGAAGRRVCRQPVRPPSPDRNRRQGAHRFRIRRALRPGGFCLGRRAAAAGPAFRRRGRGEMSSTARRVPASVSRCHVRMPANAPYSAFPHRSACRSLFDFARCRPQPLDSREPDCIAGRFRAVSLWPPRLPGERYLMVRQPDGALACLPEWMTDPYAAGFEVRYGGISSARRHGRSAQ